MSRIALPPLAEPARVQAVRELAGRAPPPDPRRRVLTGTAGWTDPSLLATDFYPPGARRPAARLAHYASKLPFVEVDATYYALPPPSTAERWLAATPPAFVFDVKAHPALTRHALDVARLPSALAAELQRRADARGRVPAARVPEAVRRELEDRFRQLVARLASAARLGAVLLQFPPWFGPTRGNARWVEELASRWADVPLAVELRHAGWFEGARRGRWLDLLRRNGLTHVVVDGPRVGVRGAPAVWAVTSPRLALVRLHGRNQAAWARRGATVHERFDWLYSPDELRGLLPALERLAADSERVHVVLNNCVRDYAVLDALALAALLEPTEG